MVDKYTLQYNIYIHIGPGHHKYYSKLMLQIYDLNNFVSAFDYGSDISEGEEGKEGKESDITIVTSLSDYIQQPGILLSHKDRKLD